MYLPLKITQVTKDNYDNVVERVDYLQGRLDNGQGTGAEKQERDQLLDLLIKYCDEKENNMSKLIGLVINEIRNCLEEGDITSLELLLQSTPEENLIAFLPDEMGHSLKKGE